MSEEENQSKKNRTKITGFWNWSKFFFMKWRFRLDQARAIFGLLTFAFLLAAGYVEYISFLDKLGFWGVIIFTILIFIVFIIGGYLYDRVFSLWSENQAVNIERNPYTYVPSPKEQWYTMAVYGYIFNSLNQIAKKLEIDLDNEDELRLFLQHYLSMSPNTPNYVEEVEKLKVISKHVRERYMQSGKIASYDEVLAVEEKETKKNKKKEKSKSTK